MKSEVILLQGRKFSTLNGVAAAMVAYTYDDMVKG